MRWGVRRYQNYDGTRKAAGKKHEAEKRKGMSDETKSKLKKAAVAVLVIGGVAASAYVISQHPEMINYVKNGKNAVKDYADNLVGDAPKLQEIAENSSFKKLDTSKIPSSVTEAFGDLNNSPLKKPDDVKNNCTNVFLGFAGRKNGYDVKPGWQKDAAGNFIENKLEDVVKCFNLDLDSALKSGRVKEYTNANKFLGINKAQETLSNIYPDNGSWGYLEARFKFKLPFTKDQYYEARHAVTWQNEDGNIVFGDGVNGLKAFSYFSNIMPNKRVAFFRADDLEFNLDEASKYLLKN